MSTVTIEHIQAKHDEVTALIAKFKEQPVPSVTRIEMQAVAFDLRIGERYAGAVLDEAGKVKHHLILLPEKQEGGRNWEAAKSWASGLGAHLPTRQEAALLYANCKPHLRNVWHWTSEPEGSSHAWTCTFNNGSQYYYDRSAGGAAVAVRRLNP